MLLAGLYPRMSLAGMGFNSPAFLANYFSRKVFKERLKIATMNDAYAAQIAQALQQIVAELQRISTRLNALTIATRK